MQRVAPAGQSGDFRPLWVKLILAVLRLRASCPQNFKKNTNTICLHLQPARVVRSSQTLHGGTARWDHSIRCQSSGYRFAASCRLRTCTVVLYFVFVCCRLYEDHSLDPPVTYVSWLLFGLPHAVLCLSFAYGWLLLVFLGWRYSLNLLISIKV